MGVWKNIHVGYASCTMGAAPIDLLRRRLVLRSLLWLSCQALSHAVPAARGNGQQSAVPQRCPHLLPLVRGGSRPACKEHLCRGGRVDHQRMQAHVPASGKMQAQLSSTPPPTVAASHTCTWSCGTLAGGCVSWVLAQLVTASSAASRGGRCGSKASAPSCQGGWGSCCCSCCACWVAADDGAVASCTAS